ncbi:MAG: GTP-binding protein [Pseudomonadota bacterium]
MAQHTDWSAWTGYLARKGIVSLVDMEKPFVFHGVQHIFAPPLPIGNWRGEDRRNRIVVISRDVSRPELQESFDMLKAQFVPKNLEHL